MQVPGQSGSGNGNFNAFGQSNGNNNTNNVQVRPDRLRRWGAFVTMLAKEAQHLVECRMQ